MSVAAAVRLTIGSRPADFTFALVIRRAGAAAVNAVLEASTLAESFPVAYVPAFTSANVRPWRV